MIADLPPPTHPPTHLPTRPDDMPRLAALPSGQLLRTPHAYPIVDFALVEGPDPPGLNPPPADPPSGPQVPVPGVPSKAAPRDAAHAPARPAAAPLGGNDGSSGPGDGGPDGRTLHLFQLSGRVPGNHSLAEKAYTVDVPSPFTHIQVRAQARWASLVTTAGALCVVLLPLSMPPPPYLGCAFCVPPQSVVEFWYRAAFGHDLPLDYQGLQGALRRFASAQKRQREGRTDKSRQECVDDAGLEEAASTASHEGLPAHALALALPCELCVCVCVGGGAVPRPAFPSLCVSLSRCCCGVLVGAVGAVGAGGCWVCVWDVCAWRVSVCMPPVSPEAVGGRLLPPGVQYWYVSSLLGVAYGPKWLPRALNFSVGVNYVPRDAFDVDGMEDLE